MTISGHQSRDSLTGSSLYDGQKTAVETLRTLVDPNQEAVFLSSEKACYSSGGLLIEYWTTGEGGSERHSVVVTSETCPNRRVHFGGKNAASHARDLLQETLSSH